MRNTILIVLVAVAAIMGFFGVNAEPLPNPFPNPAAEPNADAYMPHLRREYEKNVGRVVVAILGFHRVSTGPVANSMANPHALSKAEPAALILGESMLRRALGIPG